MANKTWYFKQSVIDQINAAGTENGPQSWGTPSWLGTVKNIQLTFVNDVPTVQQSSIEGVLVESESYVEFQNGDKYYFPYFGFSRNPETPELQIYNGELAFPLKQGSPNRLEFEAKRFSPFDWLYCGPANNANEFDLQLELNSIAYPNALEVILPRESIAGVVENVLLLSPTPPVGNSGGGGASSDQNPTSSTMVDDKVVGLVSVNPKTTAVTMNGQPLPVGSMVKNSVTGQKFYKNGNGVNDFIAIEITPPVEWGWSEGGSVAWAILQNL
jgi:hypothetical protein